MWDTEISYVTNFTNFPTLKHKQKFPNRRNKKCPNAKLFLNKTKYTSFSEEF